MNTNKPSEKSSDRNLTYFERYGNRLKSNQESKTPKMPSYRAPTPNLFLDQAKVTPQKRAQSRGTNQYGQPTTTFASDFIKGNQVQIKQPLTSRPELSKPSFINSNLKGSQKVIKSQASLFKNSLQEETLFNSSSKKQIKPKIEVQVEPFSSRVSKQPPSREKYTLERAAKKIKNEAKEQNIYQKNPNLVCKDEPKRNNYKEQYDQNDEFDDEAYLADMMKGQEDCLSELLKDHDNMLAGFLEKTTYQEEEKETKIGKLNRQKQSTIDNRKPVKKKKESALDLALKRNKLRGKY